VAALVVRGAVRDPETGVPEVPLLALDLIQPLITLTVPPILVGAVVEVGALRVGAAALAVAMALVLITVWAAHPVLLAPTEALVLLAVHTALTIL